MIKDHATCLSGKYFGLRKLLPTQSSHPKNVAEAQTLRSAKDLMTSKKEKVVSVWLLFSEEKSQMLLEVMGSWNP